ncbi:ABC transporter substrate-binding protein [Agrobacterium sp. a22-2]|uniref:ABC transporter substrate-binding protein n=1 Tax=Agrobacterium sp. a22-2 TaxID=2283840 RepID=UPI0014462C59|nr:ABC transporter substrate-binding protein [Agrobacterium sp. a22-2]NKN37529.1 ABC transporter substrate-binding protein [Agrobacterium sp. a22-2]
MINRRTLLALMASGITMRPACAINADAEPESLADLVRSGKLPPMRERLPQAPRIIPLTESGQTPGRYGGKIRMLIASQRDIRYMPIYSYSRLVGYDRKFNFQPDILRHFEVEDERVFTLHLRPGHRWSDGTALTAEDFRYVWEDMFHNTELHRGGIPTILVVNGKGPKFEMLDDITLRYSWEHPNPEFLGELASPVATRLMQPSQYMKQFHPKYQTPERLQALVKEQNVQDWVALHQKMSRSARPENPDLPTLDPWRNTTSPPSGYFVFERNPYFHRADENGLQLPYVDAITLSVGSGDLISAKTASGESDLQLNNISFSDYTFLKSAEPRGEIEVDLWKRMEGSRVALIPNLNCADLIWRRAFSDVRVRRALSLAINRDEINKAVFFGLGQPSSNSVLPDSPLFRQRYRDEWAYFDPDQANALLDEAGLTRKNKHGLRHLPDGRECSLIVETTAENSFETDVLELVTDYFQGIGIHIYTHVSHRELFRQRIINGNTLMALWWGIDNGVPTANMSPRELAPTSNDQIQWPLWGLHELSGGGEGRPPEIAEAQSLLDLFHRWRSASTLSERETIWHDMLEVFTQQVFTIGIVNSVLQPVVKNKRLRNLPDEGLFGFDPTSYLGVYMPDTFWLEGEA